jgi:hypothetical protein
MTAMAAGRRIYVASSWRCLHQPSVVQTLRLGGHEVYDFRNPGDGEHGFAWSAIDPLWQSWTPAKFRDALHHPMAVHGFDLDMAALAACDVCVLVMPAGRSANLELGWAVGQRKWTVVFLPERCEPELMWRMCSRVVCSIPELCAAVREVGP